MREIKFRAWDEKEKCWVSGFAIHQSGMFSDWAGCKKINGQCVADADWKYQHEIPHIKIMQYTGLRDKNGKEIYEGDIIRTQTMHYNGSGQFIGMTDRIASVVFHNGRFALRMESGAMPDLSFGLSFHEVIGNIYDHPHLLKGAEA